jgi:PAS domain S-box-containing protein/putative nucleotidyltransferase with HDIG domain
LKNTSPKKKTTIGHQSKLKQSAKATAKLKNQRVEQKQKPSQTLINPELLYRSLFENVLNGFAYCKMIFEQGQPEDFIYLEVNKTFESLTGLKDVVGKRASEVISGLRETDPALFDLYGRVALTGKPERLETYVKALKKWFLISVYSSQKEYFVAVFDVITERKQINEALERYVKRLEQTERYASLGSWEFDVIARRGWWSRQMYRMLYFEELSDVPGNEEYLEHIHPDDRPYLQDVLISMSQGKEPTPQEFRSNPEFGPMRYLDPTYFVERDSQRKPMKYIGTLHDITESKQAEEALRSNEEQYRTLFEAVPTGIGVADRNGNLLAFNDAILQPGGYTREDILKIGGVQGLYFDLDQREHAMALYKKQGFLNHYEVKFKRKDGTQYDALLTLTPVEFKGKPCVQALVEDITERKQAEEEIKNLAKFPDENPSPVLRLNEKGIILYANSASQAVLENWKAAVGQEAPAFWRQKVTEVLANHSKQVVDISIGERILSFVIAPIIEARYVNLYGRDITEREQAEKALVNERNLLRTLIDNLPVVVYVKDLEGRFILKNLLDARQMGASSPEETIGKTDFDYYSHDLATQYYADDQAVFQSGKPIVNREEPIIDATGRSGWVLTTKVPLRDPQGKVIGLVGIGHDITERKQAEKRIQRQLEHLTALREIDQVVTSSFDLHSSLTDILRHVKKELGVDAADVLLLNNAYQLLEYSAGVGFRTKAAEKESVRVGQSHAGRAALDRQLIQIPDLKDQLDDILLKDVLAGEDFVCYYGVPLITKGSVKGVLEVYNRTPLEPDQEWLDFLNTLAGQTALAIDNAHLFDSLQRSNIDLTLAYDATIEGWSRAMDLRDKETEGHTLRVTGMTMELAGLFGITDEDLVSIRCGALLHDIGKMGVPDVILLKPTTLTDEEWVIMKKHPTLAFEMLSPIHYLKSAIDIPYCHHEKWDGTGYPRGLKGEQIPLPARIFTIIDVWDALTSDRPYRNAWSKEKALDYLKSEAGKTFDPQIVKVCLDSGVFDRKDRN